MQCARIPTRHGRASRRVSWKRFRSKPRTASRAPVERAQRPTRRYGIDCLPSDAGRGSDGTMKGTVLIAGASGLVGAAAVDSFLADGYDVIALSRRRPEVESSKPFTHAALDLQDGGTCRDAAKGFGAVTHVVYTAVFELPGLVPGWSERIQMETNLAMLRNLMEPLSQNATGLKHVSL